MPEIENPIDKRINELKSYSLASCGDGPLIRRIFD
tara:strand:+ start:298 stop:402 length:105 start_codon:yes stop_codon:yes gene_type:complete